MSPRGTLRILPLGGLGEIGKNMTVVEYDGRIVVVDTGLMFPTPDQLGIDLVLPDFAYLLERSEAIEAIVLTPGHEDHVGALPFALRQLDRAPPIFGGPLTAAMVRSKLDEHRLKDVPVEDVLARTMDLGGTGGILVASHLAGREMRRIVDEPDRRHEIEDGLRDLYKALTVTTNPIPIKAALNLAGHDVGGPRLPLVEATEEEKAVIRAALERHELLAAV